MAVVVNQRNVEEIEVLREEEENHVIVKIEIEVRHVIDDIEVHQVIEEEIEVRQAVEPETIVEVLPGVSHVIKEKNRGTGNDHHQDNETGNEVQVDHVINTVDQKLI